tara:strand:- start:9237 stop:10211 length:975 start_codon:yes stop_codon:yes gene_type:complete
MELKPKSFELLDKATVDIIHKFSIQQKVKISGSAKYRGILYASDIDLTSDLSGRAEVLAKYFKDAFSNKSLLSKIFFMDFKCGVDDRLVYDEDTMTLKKYLQNPLIKKSMKTKIMKASGKEREDLIRDLYILRWTPKQIVAGRIKLIDGTFKTFVSCLKDDTRIKFDFIFPNGGEFVEISEIYFYKETPMTKVETIESLTEDIKYYKSFNILKSMKRFFSLLELQNKHKKQRQAMVQLFNSDVGFLNKIMNDLDLVASIIDRITPTQLKNVAQVNIERLGRLSYLSQSKILLLNKPTIKNINELTDYLLKILNKISTEYIEELF